LASAAELWAAKSSPSDRAGEDDAEREELRGEAQRLLSNPDTAWNKFDAMDFGDANPHSGDKKRTAKKVSISENVLSQATKELLDAASSGDLKGLKTLAARGADCNGHDYDNRTALHIACAAGHLPMVKFLLSQKSSVVNCVDRFCVTPLMEATKKAGVGSALVSLLLKKGAVKMNQRSGPALCAAAASGNVAKLEELQSCGVELSTADYDGRTALHLAASEGQVDAVRWLLDNEAAVNVVDRVHGTPLDDAMRDATGNKGNASVIAELLTKAGGKTGASVIGSSGVSNPGSPNKMGSADTPKDLDNVVDTAGIQAEL
jgi:hypothetical protein